MNDKNLALCFRLKNGGCKIYVFEWNKGEFHNLSTAAGLETLPLTRFIHRAGSGHILSTGLAGSPSVVYSANLHEKQEIPFVFDFLISASGKLAASSQLTSWTLYQLVPSMQQLRQGTGELLSISEDALAVQRGDKIYIETLDGGDLGFLAVKPTKCFTYAKVLYRNALFVDECSHQYIADFAGKRLANTRAPEGNPLRTETNESGSRLLFDHATGMSRFLGAQRR